MHEVNLKPENRNFYSGCVPAEKISVYWRFGQKLENRNAIPEVTEPGSVENYCDKQMRTNWHKAPRNPRKSWGSRVFVANRGEGGDVVKTGPNRGPWGAQS